VGYFFGKCLSEIFVLVFVMGFFVGEFVVGCGGVVGSIMRGLC